MDTRKIDRRCPAGVADCAVTAELAQLREQCRTLETLSYIDALTGLYNFRYMHRALEMEMERTRRTMLPTSLIMADLDHFKNINGTYGHEAGNTALSWVGRLLREGIRIIDVACRYGGEEFALILPSTSLVQSSSIAERLRIIISTNPVLLNGRPVTLTASFGVTVFSYTDNWTVSEFLSNTDELLFKAKSAGRDRVFSQRIEPVLPEHGVTQEEKDLLFGNGNPPNEDGR